MIKFSVVLPFYNEEGAVRKVVSDILAVMRVAGYNFELICVQNGSADRTAEILNSLSVNNPEIIIVVVPVNKGYGYGVRQGFNVAQGETIGFFDGDGQIGAEDAVRVLDGMNRRRASKGIRISRGDGLYRKMISFFYNKLFRFLFGINSDDANAKPKFLKREDLNSLSLVSDDWFIDAEIMIKAAALKIDWEEVLIYFNRRNIGRSNVSFNNVINFFFTLLKWRFGKQIKIWKNKQISKE